MHSFIPWTLDRPESLPDKRGGLRIVMLAENDPAGTAIGFARAVNRLSPHVCRLITWQRRYVCEFPADVHLPDLAPGLWPAVADLVRSADLIHFHMLADELLQIGPWQLAGLIGRKPIIRHHHGHPRFRASLDAFRSRYATERAQDVVLVSTPDMLNLFPPGRARWQPNLVPLEDSAYRPTTADEWAARRGPLRVQQSPTRRGIKSTDRLQQSIARLAAEGLAIELDLTERETHAEVLRRRRLADVVFDQMDYSFGVSSLEGLAMGRAVICRLDGFNRRAICEFAGCTETDLPWSLADDDDGLDHTLRKHARDAAAGRAELARRGAASRAFMDRHWPESRVIAPLLAAWDTALRQHL